MLPPHIEKLFQDAVTTERKHLETEGHVSHKAFVGNTVTDLLITIVFEWADEDAKDGVIHHIRTVAASIEADFVLTVGEGWSLPTHKLLQHEDIVRKYGSVANSPFKVEVVYFNIETAEGSWVGQARIRPHTVSKKRRTFGPVEFASTEPVENVGNFGSLLLRPAPPGTPVH